MVGGIAQGLMTLNNSNYVEVSWHATLLALAVTAFSVAFNTYFAEILPLIEGTILILHFIGLFAINIPLCVMSPRGKASDVSFEFTNHGGWPTKGLSAMIGLTTLLTVLIGYDLSVHMETRDASRVLIKAIIWSVGINATMGFLMAVILTFTHHGDLDSILNSITGQPSTQVFFNATQSYDAHTLSALL